MTRRIHSSLILALLLTTGVSAAMGKPNSWSLASPNGQCAISVSFNDDGSLTYQVSHAGKPVIPPSSLGLRCNDQSFEHALKFDRAGKVEKHHERYELFAGTQPHVDHVLNQRTLAFHNTNGLPIEIELAASDEGVAFRYQLPQKSAGVHVIEAETTAFTLPLNARGWLQPYHSASAYTPAYEDFYFHVSPGDPLPQRSHGHPVGWAFPALFQVPDASAWVLLTEAGTEESYCACHLGPDSANGVYRIAFPLADEATKNVTNKFGPEPRFTLPWTMPWRVFVLGKSPGDIGTSTLVTDLSAPSQIADTSWIKPGRASWAWWSYPEGPATAELFNRFTDFGAKMGWEYTLFDAGWWKPGIKPIAEHAKIKGVMPLAWAFATDFYNAAKRAKSLDNLAAAGVRGVKVDFWCSDRQEAIAAQLALMRDAAARRMVVNLHGCTIPRGWQRTWPNLLSTEAVLGAENYLYESHYTERAAELNAVLPFTRNAVGPMDFTPVGCSPKRYARTTTAAHELAASLIFTSGIIHYADKPEFFESLPAAALQILRDAPARWDETRCLIGEPGRLAIFARRAGKSWFIAGINGTDDTLPVNLDLSPFKEYANRLLISEGSNASMEVASIPMKESKQWQHALPARGGFILRMDLF